MVHLKMHAWLIKQLWCLLMSNWACVRGWGVLLLGLLLCLAALYNTTTCSSCSSTSQLLWLSLQNPSSPQELVKHKNSSDEELKGGSPVHQSFNTDAEGLGSVQPHLAHSRSSAGKARNDTHVHRTLPTPPHGYVGRVQHGHESFKTRKLELDLFAAKQAIANAGANADTHLYAPLYHNISMFIKSYELMEKMFKIYVYNDGSQPLVHVGPIVDIYASEGRFIHQLQNSKRFITRDPEKAQMFFLPYSVHNMVTNLYVPDSHSMRPLTSFITSYVNSIASKYPFWNRSHGADHFFASCHDWGPATARGHPELRLKSIKVVCNADVTEGFVVGKDVSLPETYMHAEKPPNKLGGPPPRKRPYLAFFAGQMHGRVRPVLLKHWKDKEPDMKIYETLPRAIAKKTSYVRHMKMSKFCICPMGYEVNSPRIVEAIYYDCVPVIIADNFVLPFSEVLNWNAFSVIVEEKEVPQLKRILLSIPATRYRSLQANLKHVRRHFMWHYKIPTKYDIFHMILHSVWLSRLSSLSLNLS